MEFTPNIGNQICSRFGPLMLPIKVIQTKSTWFYQQQKKKENNTDNIKTTTTDLLTAALLGNLNSELLELQDD